MKRVSARHWLPTNMLPDYIRILTLEDKVLLYVNRRNNRVLRSDDFLPEVLMAIAKHVSAAQTAGNAQTAKPTNKKEQRRG